MKAVIIDGSPDIVDIVSLCFKTRWPEVRILPAFDGRKGLELVKAQFDNVNVIVFGHSHSPVNEVQNGALFFNPGSPTDKIFASYNSVGILEVGDTIKGRIIRL